MAVMSHMQVIMKGLKIAVDIYIAVGVSLILTTTVLRILFAQAMGLNVLISLR
jgi:hypothetical protein